MDFSKINQQGKKSFNDQKAIIKKVLSGRTVNCNKCHQPLIFKGPEVSDVPQVCCPKGCMSIELDICP